MVGKNVMGANAMTEVSAAIIERDGEVLICRRAQGRHCAHLWEFPGGKREAGESAEACLCREISEELAVDIRVDGLFARFVWEASGRPLLFSFFFATILDGEPVCREHEALCWVARGALSAYAFCPADVQVAARLAGGL